MSIPRINELHRQRARKRKLKLLKKRYQAATTAEEKEKVLEKVKVIAPWLNEEEYCK